MIIDNSSTPTIVFLMVDETDLKTAETGLTPTVQISKNGGVLSAATNAVTEIASGLYKVTLTATETNTDGALWVIATSAGAADWRQEYWIKTVTPVNVTQVAGLSVAGVGDFKADVGTLSTFDPLTDTVDVAKVNGVSVTNIDDFKADVSTLATSAALATVDTNVDSILADTGTDGVVIATTTQESIADTLLLRNMVSVIGSVPYRSLMSAIRWLVNKNEVDDITNELRIYEEDDTTVAFEQDTVFDANGNITTRGGAIIAD